jgi:4-amino-4-deoxy-L-arabinose transferase-like glycosyltransferase
MGMEPSHDDLRRQVRPSRPSACAALAVLAVIVGVALLIGASWANSATYDEVAYLRVAARWWRTGDQAEITRMGSPLLFWKLQQAPLLWLLDHVGKRDWVDDPIAHQQDVLPWMRIASLWIWLVAIGITIAWSRHELGPRAMALAAWLFALSPNLIAHGALVTMELPLVACTTAMFCFFWRYLDSGRWRWLWATAAVGGAAFSCKFTAIVVPPILAVIWWFARWRDGEHRALRLTRHVILGMAGFAAVMVIANLTVNAGAAIPLSANRGEHPTLDRWLGPRMSAIAAQLYESPMPQDWVAFATQFHHQATGGSSYLFGERRMTGWWYYYFVALMVKVPLTFWLLVVARLTGVAQFREGESACGGCEPPVHPARTEPRTPKITKGRSAFWHENQQPTQGRSHFELLPLVFVLYLAITAMGSSRNYGVRYLLPLAPVAIVWVSALAESASSNWRRIAIAAGLAGYALAIAGAHPYELTYFNALAGGRIGGRHVLADSNFDWGQGLKSLARLQRTRSEFCNLTLYYFGDTDPAHYGIAGQCYVVNAVDDHSRLPGLETVNTTYVAVSASLQWGPWGPGGFFRALNRLEPVAYTDDTTIAIYRTAGAQASIAVPGNSTRTGLPAL